MCTLYFDGWYRWVCRLQVVLRVVFNIRERMLLGFVTYVALPTNLHSDCTVLVARRPDAQLLLCTVLQLSALVGVGRYRKQRTTVIFHVPLESSLLASFTSGSHTTGTAQLRQYRCVLFGGRCFWFAKK